MVSNGIKYALREESFTGRKLRESRKALESIIRKIHEICANKLTKTTESILKFCLSLLAWTFTEQCVARSLQDNMSICLGIRALFVLSPSDTKRHEGGMLWFYELTHSPFLKKIVEINVDIFFIYNICMICRLFPLQMILPKQVHKHLSTLAILVLKNP